MQLFGYMIDSNVFLTLDYYTLKHRILKQACMGHLLVNWLDIIIESQASLFFKFTHACIQINSVLFFVLHSMPKITNMIETKAQF